MTAIKLGDKNKFDSTNVRTILINLTLLFVLLSTSLVAQSNYKIVIISPIVGEEIDKSEREFYHLFTTINGFEKGIFFADTSGTYYVYITFKDKNGNYADTVIHYTSAYIIRMSEVIDNFEKVTKGEYTFHRTEYSFDTVDDVNNLLANLRVPTQTPSTKNSTIKPKTVKKTKSIEYADELKLSDQKIDISLEYYPRFGFGAGISTALKPEGINKILNSIENNYINQGYPISHHEVEINNDYYLWFILKLRITENISVSFDVGSTMKDNPSDLKSVAVYGIYSPKLFGIKWLKPYAGLGISSNVFSLKQEFYYNNRISPIDTSGGYDYLNSINFQGNAKSFGTNYVIGIQFLTSGTEFNIYAHYSMLEFDVKDNSNPEAYKINFDGFTFGIKFLIYL